MIPTATACSSASIRLRARRRALMLGSALAALALVSAPERASAQAFQGTPATSAGSVTYNRAVPGVETITINSGTAIINWTPSDANSPIVDFLPAGNVATFQNNPNGPNFAVLNRIIPTGAGQTIALNGHVVSQLQTGAGNVRGGTVAFYTPNGLIIGASAVFDVGSLMLTTLDPVDWATFAAGGQTRFTTPNSSSFIQIQPGAQINADVAEGSYVAMMAPRIDMDGAVRVNGSAGYIAADSVDLTINNGLFDIQVATGSSDSQGIDHTGSTGGPASTAASDNHRIYMVAVPKNQAITMLLTGSVGFDSAVSASVENGAILLSAGHNVSGDFIGSRVNGTEANVHIETGTYTSDLTGQATHNIFAAPFTGSASFAGDVSLTGGARAHIAGRNGHTVTIGGNASVSTNPVIPGLNPGDVTAGESLIYSDGAGSLTIAGNVSIQANGYTAGNTSAATGTGGQARMFAVNGGSITVQGTTHIFAMGSDIPVTAGPGEVASNGQGGNAEIYVNGAGSAISLQQVQLSASGRGQRASSGGGGVSGAGHGGTANVIAQGGGTISAAEITADASGAGGALATGGSLGGAGSGGSTNIIAETGGAITVTTTLNASALGVGGSRFTPADSGVMNGGTGTGGSVFIAANSGGTLTVNGNSMLSANGFGGTGWGGGAGGLGDGGFVALRTNSGGIIDFNGSLTGNADGQGGSGQTGGAGLGGSAGMIAFSGRIELGAATNLSGRAIGGSANQGFGGAGGAATGGEAYVQADQDGTSGGTITAGNVTLDVSGSGGSGGAGDGGTIAAGAGGRGQGGRFNGTVGSGGVFLLAQADRATLQVANATLLANGFGGAGGAGGAGQTGGAGGEGQGGSTQSGTFIGGGSGTVMQGSARFVNLTQNASGTGGAGGAGGSGQGAGGAGLGGGSLLTARGTTAQGSQVEAHTVSLFAGGTGGAGGDIGGDGTGGTAGVIADGGDVSVQGLLGAYGSGFGGTGYTAGDGVGGSAGVNVDLAGSVTVGGTLETFAYGLGGNAVGSGPGTGAAGDGIGGDVDVTVLNGSRVSVARADITGRGRGGNYQANGSGSGGTGRGGSSTLMVGTDSLFETTGTDTNTDGYAWFAALANGGVNFSGSRGGDAYGGTVNVTASGGTIRVRANIQATSTATGGSYNSASPVDTDGGNAVAGVTEVTIESGGKLVASNIAAQADATGGAGFGTGNGGSAQGGAAALRVLGGEIEMAGIFASDPNFIVTSTVESFATGGQGVIGGAATGGVSILTVEDGGTLTASTAHANPQVGSFRVYSNATGGAGTTQGGAATGGTSAVLVDSATAASSSAQFRGLTVESNATGGAGAAGTGGNALAGHASLTSNGASQVTITDSEFRDFDPGIITLTSGLQAIGIGGNGTVAGTGTGGNVLLQAAGGGGLNAATAVLDVNGLGGSGAGSDGGDGTGGIIQVLSSGAGSRIDIIANPQLSQLHEGMMTATGRGGENQGGGDLTGGTGTGGHVDIRAQAGGSINLPASPGNAGFVRILARGFGGAASTEGGVGGTGQGGTIDMGVDGGTMTALSLLPSNYGQGGSSAAPGANITGGDGFGGDRLIYARNGGVLTISANGGTTGGLGGGGSGTGNGGDGSGGNTRLEVDGGRVELPGRLLILSQSGGGNGRIGGAASGAVATVALSNGGVIIGTTPQAELSVGGTAFGGHGLVQGGSAFGGTSVLEIGIGAGSTIDVASGVFLATGQGGSVLDLSSGNGGAGWGGQATVNVGNAGDLVRFGTLSVAARGIGGSSFDTTPSNTGGGGTGGAASVSVTAGELQVTGSLTVDASGFGGGAAHFANGGIGRGGFAHVTASGGATSLADLNLLSDGAGGEGGTSPGAGNGGQSLIGITGGSFGASGAVNMSAQATGGATAFGDLRVQVRDTTAGFGSLTMTAAGTMPITVGDVSGPRPAMAAILLQNGNLTIHGNAAIQTPGQVLLDAEGAIRLAIGGDLAIAAGGHVTFAAEGNASFDIGGALTVTSDGDIIVTHDEPDTGAPEAIAGDGEAQKAPPSGVTTLAADSIALAGRNIDTTEARIAADTTIATQARGTTRVGDVSAGESISLGLASNLTGADQFAAEIRGVIRAPRISIESSDLIIAPTGQLGVPGVTELVSLRVRGSEQQTLVGGDPVARTGYTLDRTEAGRIETRAFSMFVPAVSSGSSRPADLVVRDIDIIGSADNGVSSVDIGTSGIARVEGEVNFTNAASTDRLTVRGDQRIEVITPDGGIRMVNPSGNLSGILTLQSENIVVASGSLASQLAADPNFSGRDAALLNNSGPVNPAGYLQAGGIELLSGGTIFIQNTGTSTEFAGLTVGERGLLVGRYQASTNPDGTRSFSFVGTLTDANGVLFFDFTVTSETTITLRTYSYAGGTNAAGETIPAGGFDPILALFNAAGTLIGQNDDGGANVPADPTTGAHFDTFLQQLLPAGSYRVSVTAYSNFAQGPNVSNGFTGGGSFGGRTGNFAFDVLGAGTATGPGGSTTPLTIIAFGRRQNSDGSFTTGSDFFQSVDFGTDVGVTYTSGSRFNDLAIGAPIPPPDPQPQPDIPAAPLPPDVVQGPLTQAEDPVTGEESSPAVGFDVRSEMVDVSGLSSDTLIEEPVTSGGDSSLWGEDDDEDEEDEEDDGNGPSGE